MKTLKMLGIAALVASGLVIAGAGTAQATTVFTDSAKTIDYPSGTEIDWSQAQAWDTRLLAFNGTTLVTCTGSTIRGVTDATTAPSLSTPISQFAWSGCSQTIHTIANGSLRYAFTSGSSGQVTGSGSSWTIVTSGVSCTYGTGEGTKLGTVTGGTPAVMEIDATLTKLSGGLLCYSTVNWKTKDVLTAPHALYVGS